MSDQPRLTTLRKLAILFFLGAHFAGAQVLRNAIAAATVGAVECTLRTGWHSGPSTSGRA